MADRSSYRTQYEHKVAQLGVVEGASEEETNDEERVQDKTAQDAAIHRARLLVCGHSQNPTEALDLMEHLGISPEQQTPYDKDGHITGLNLRVYSFSIPSLEETS